MHRLIVFVKISCFYANMIIEILSSLMSFRLMTRVGGFCWKTVLGHYPLIQLKLLLKDILDFLVGVLSFHELIKFLFVNGYYYLDSNLKDNRW